MVKSSSSSHTSRSTELVDRAHHLLEQVTSPGLKPGLVRAENRVGGVIHAPYGAIVGFGRAPTNSSHSAKASSPSKAGKAIL